MNLSEKNTNKQSFSSPVSGNAYSRFITKVKQKTGIDLSLYKEAQMKRRLKSFYEKRNFQSFDDFFDHGLNKDKQLLEQFLERMTINVSEFFRNPKRWEVLDRSILPSLLKINPSPRVWSAACSTGEEPYTLVMLLSQHLSFANISVLATDIDESILQRAKTGFYTDRSLKEMPPSQVTNFFKKDPPGYKVNERVKSRVTFKKHNLLSDPFGGPFELIVCRNVLIYFTEKAKEDLYKKFNRALTIGGVLFVGSTEQIFNPGRYGFEAEDTFFYKKVKDV